MEFLQEQGFFGLFIFGIGFSVVILGISLLTLNKFGVIRFKRSHHDKTSSVPVRDDEPIKQLIRDQNQETRKVVYEMKQEQQIHQAVLDNTLVHFEKGIDKMVDVLSEVQQDIKQALISARKNGGKG